MNRLKIATAALFLLVPLASCTTYNAYQKARHAEDMKDWDVAVTQYEKALTLDPTNARFRISLQRALLEASRVHFEKGKSLRAAAADVTGAERGRLAQLAAVELQLTVKLDPTNQYAAVEFQKAIGLAQDAARALDRNSIDEIKRRAKNNVSKAQPPTLNPASDTPISLSFPHETPVKDIYRALGNAFGINILFDQAVKDDRIAIELRDVTAQAALERVMQAANHFYKVLDEKTIIVVPDNPQARRDYEDLVIQTFYLSNGDAEQVTNVVRTMIEARNVFPLKALNAITIRDTADKVRIAEKIIQANDKAKSEVVVDVELLQLDLNTTRNIGLNVAGTNGEIAAYRGATDDKGVTTSAKIGTITLSQLRTLGSDAFQFTMPTVQYSLLKSEGNSELLANPELRISEGEKATLHIGQRIPVPVTTFTTAVQSGTTGSLPATSYQYQDVGIKVSIEPRVHHNREVTLKLTVEVSNPGANAPGTGTADVPAQPTFSTRTIESTIRLKDGETNFLAGLIQDTKTQTDNKTPFLGDIPVIGRLFTNQTKGQQRTDLLLTMTPHIIRIPDITEDDLAPMWVGTTNNLTFRGVSPRIESQAGIDPFTATGTQFSNNPPNPQNLPLNDSEPGNFIQPQAPNAPGTRVPTGSGPTDVFNRNNPQPPNPQLPAPIPEPQVQLDTTKSPVKAASMSVTATASSSAPALSPRIGPQPVTLPIKPGEEKLWNVVGMDLDGLSTTELLLHYDPRSLDINEVLFGSALRIDPKAPPVATINRDAGLVRITSSDGKPLVFISGGEVMALRVHGGLSGDTFLIMEQPAFHTAAGDAVVSAVTGGRAKVE
ncbi:MAG TPA: secretin N-terminal domain-containing protein [Thermoanaerobaculia bacterium]|nr:secretin N-terminal domain-containing protein [Thermoanaerobaculia bacterium]